MNFEFLTKKRAISLLDEDSPLLLAELEDMCLSFPFNYTFWNQYAQLVAQKKGKEDARMIYEKAIDVNPRCFQLWKFYVQWVRDEFPSTDIPVRTLENALKNIGRDFESFYLWEDYIKIQTSLGMENTINAYRKVFCFPIRNIDQFWPKFTEYLNTRSSTQLVDYHKQFQNDPLTSVQEIKDGILRDMERIYKINLNYVKEKVKYEDKLTRFEYDEKSNDDFETWCSYLKYEHLVGNYETIHFLYEKALISQCDKFLIWTDYFDYLYLSANQFLKMEMLQSKYQQFLSKFGAEYTYYAIDIEEERDPAKARQMLKQLTQNQNSLKPLIYLLQFERRQQNFTAIRELYAEFLNERFKPGSREHSYFLLQYLEMLYNQNPTDANSYFKHALATFGYCKEAYCLQLQQQTLYYSKQERYFDLTLDFTNYVLNAVSSNWSDFQSAMSISKQYLQEAFQSVHLIREAMKKFNDLYAQVEKKYSEENTNHHDHVEKIEKKLKQK